MIVRHIPPPREATWFWRVLWVIAWLLKQWCARLEVEGLEHLPATGGFIVTCNHTRGFDFVPLGFVSPRQVYFLVKAEAFGVNPLLTYILNQGGGIPVQRGSADLNAFQKAIDKLHQGYPVAIFPEGTRSSDGTLQKGHTGAVRIAMHAKVPIVPAVVIGAEEMLRQFWKPWKRTPVLVRFGPPLHVEGNPANRPLVRAETNRMMRTMAAMLPPHMRGKWAEGSIFDDENEDMAATDGIVGEAAGLATFVNNEVVENETRQGLARANAPHAGREEEAGTGMEGAGEVAKVYVEEEVDDVR